jgi:hypothetical protein
LNQYDLNGTLSYSEIRSAQLNNSSLFNYFPNPADQLITIRSNELNNAEIRVYNSIGELVYETNEHTNASVVTINTQQFAEGIYFIHFQTASQLEIQKISIKRN